MSESEHTQGPWYWSDQWPTGDGRETWSLIAEGGYGILSCDGLANSPQCCNRADGRLIAASPDLLAALKRICKDATECECHGEPSTVDGIQWDDIVAARTAISKATGA